MLTFTLDTNCILAVANSETTAPAIQTLADAHAEGKAHVAVVAISASERQKEGMLILNFADFERRLACIGLDYLDICLPMIYCGISFWDRCRWADTSLQILEKQIHQVLFPDEEFRWSDYCAVGGLDPSTSFPNSDWRNHKCDVQALWSHIASKREVFVSNDRNFHQPSKQNDLIHLGVGCIKRPEDAAALLDQMTA